MGFSRQFLTLQTSLGTFLRLKNNPKAQVLADAFLMKQMLNSCNR